MVLQPRLEICETCLKPSQQRSKTTAWQVDIIDVLDVIRCPSTWASWPDLAKLMCMAEQHGVNTVWSLCIQFPSRISIACTGQKNDCHFVMCMLHVVMQLSGSISTMKVWEVCSDGVWKKWAMKKHKRLNLWRKWWVDTVKDAQGWALFKVVHKLRAYIIRFSPGDWEDID